MMTKVSYVLVPIMLIFTSYLSAAVNLMGTAFGIATLVSTALLNNNTVRRAFQMPLLEPPALTPKVAAVPARQYATKVYTPDGIRERLTGGLEDVKKGWSDSVAKATGGAKLSEADKSAKKVKETLAKLEQTRREKERAHFEEKYKGKR
jgi:hypothetical protein